MHPSTEPTQAPPAHARTTRSAPAAPSRGVPDQFGHALAQALAPSGPAAAGMPASPASTEATKGQPAAKGQSSAKMVPALPEAAAPPDTTPSAAPSKAVPGKAVKNGPAAPAADAKPDEPSAEAAKPSDGPQPSAPSQPTLPMPPQAAPSQAALPQAMPPQTLAVAAQPVASASEADDAPSADQESSGTAAAGAAGREAPSAPAPAAAQAAAPSASAPPSRAAVPPDAGDTVAHAMQKHLSAAMAEKEPSATAPAAPADATPLPTAALVPPNAAPAPVGVAPHPAPAPSQTPPRPSPAGEPAPPSAAVQVGPVLASFAAGAAHPGAPQHLTIRLDPLDLGRVQVRIERSPDGSARVDLKVEKPDTLLLLLRDQPQLHRALDLAGVPSTERTLQFHLAPPDAAASGGMAAQSDAGHGHGQQRPGQPQSGRFANNGTTPSLGEPTSGLAAFRRAGVDITA